MKKAVVYIHGKGGNTQEAEHYRPLFADCDVIGVDYSAETPWEAKEEFPRFLTDVCAEHEQVILIANSIGAYFAMCALADCSIERAYFISPVVDMERLIADMMCWAKVTEEILQERKMIETPFGETLSWEYLCYVRQYPMQWKIPTHILYGKKDHLTSYETISEFANRIHATLTVMEDGEHWFHTAEQMDFLDDWIKTFAQ